jgi:hypothetical protein
MAAAEQTLHQGIDLTRQLTALVPDLLPKALIRLGSLSVDSAHPERGRAPLAEALALAGSAKLSATEVAFAQNALAKVELACGHPSEMALIAERQFGRAALLLRRAQFVLESGRRAPGLQLPAVCAELANLAASEGKMAEAEDYATQSISILDLQPAPNAVMVAAAKVTLASVYIRLHDLAQLRAEQRDWPAAETLYREAAAIYGGVNAQCCWRWPMS